MKRITINRKSLLFREVKKVMWNNTEVKNCFEAFTNDGGETWTVEQYNTGEDGKVKVTHDGDFHGILTRTVRRCKLVFKDGAVLK